jgi:hypothetical protein
LVATLQLLFQKRALSEKHNSRIEVNCSISWWEKWKYRKKIGNQNYYKEQKSSTRRSSADVFWTLTTETPFKVLGSDGSIASPTKGTTGKSNSTKNFSPLSFFEKSALGTFLAVTTPILATKLMKSWFTRSDVNRKCDAANVACPQRST